MKNPKSILITGASSGIGKAMALNYAKEGTTLFISGQNEKRLEEVAKECQAQNATVYLKLITVEDQNSMSKWIIESDKIAPLDLVIANAGIGVGFKPHEDDIADHTAQVFSVNVNGVFNTVHPAIDIMKPRGSGQIAMVSSLAAYHGMPSAPAYSTSKATVKAYGEALRGLYARYGLEVNVICPGFVRSRITDKNDFPMPFFMEAEKAAKIIEKGLTKNKGRIAFPWQTNLIFSMLTNLIPEWILEKILSQMPDK
jgi:short-subunit dehydrogenase